MASVFLSYDRSDRAKAAAITAALEKAHHSVWWDQQIRGGSQYSKEIEQALKKADAVVVLWSQSSVDSAWVRDEAAEGRDSGRLIPVQIADCTPPMGFRQYQTIDLSGWKGRAGAKGIKELLAAIDSVSGESVQDEPGPSIQAGEQPRNRQLPTLAAGGLLAATTAAAALFFWTGSSHSSAPVVAVRAGDSNSGSSALARDLLVDLGNMQPTGERAPELIDGKSAPAADFIFEVADSGRSEGRKASLLLLRGDDGQVLASRDFQFAGSGSSSDQLAARAALLLGCASDASALKGKRLALVKEYINTCDQFGDYFSVSDIALLVPSLRNIISQASDFRPAVEQLLLAESVGFLVPDEWEKDAPAILRSHLELARRIDSHMPEADVAEATLLPPTAFAARIRLMDRAVASDPENPFVLAARAMELMRAGLMGAAVTDSERAARLAPLVPAARYAYIMSLGYRGQLDKSFGEVAAAQELFPQARNLIEARFRLNLRYGSADEALHALHTYGTSRAHEAFLAARIDPSPANIDRAIGLSREVVERFGYASSHAEVLAAFGKNDDLYRLLMNLPTNQPDPMLSSVLFRPLMKSFRQDRRFIQVASHFGLTQYWQRSGKWPDFCFEPDLPYDCRAEAAKLA